MRFFMTWLLLLVLLVLAGPAYADTSSLDISSILNPLLQLAGLMILSIGGIFGTIILNKIRTKYGIDVSAAQVAEMSDVATKATTWAITQSTDKIKTNGWDHIPTQNAIVQMAGEYAVMQFPGAMKNAGLDVSTVAARDSTARQLANTVMQRVLPAAMATAAASPATPPVPPQAAASDKPA